MEILAILLPATVSQFVLEVVFGFVASVIFMSFVEHVLHGYFMHRKMLPNFVYRMIPYLEKEVHEHRVLHHEKFYVQFDHEDDPYGKNLNLRITHTTNFLGLLFMSPLLILITLVTSIVPVLMLVLVIMLHRKAWNLIHTEMHIPQRAAWTHSSFYKFLARYHYLHHVSARAHSTKNYNVVLPFADYFLGKVAVPSEVEKSNMRALGYLD